MPGVNFGYPYDICNMLNNLNNFVTLNAHEIG